MALTSVGAIYATQSLLLQRIYVPSIDNSEISQQHVGAAESIQLVPISTYLQGGPSAVQSAIGTPTFSGRCGLINNTNTCINVIVADPAVYVPPNVFDKVIPSDLVEIGDTWVPASAVFQRRFAEYNPTTRIVSNVSMQNIANLTIQTAGNLLIQSTTLNVGDTVPIKASAV